MKLGAHAQVACALVLLASAGCSNSGATASSDAGAKKDGAAPKSDASMHPTKDAGRDAEKDSAVACSGVTPMMELTGNPGFFDSPFPSDARLTAAGVPDLSGFPNYPVNTLAGSVISLVSSGPHAFGTTSSIYFRFSDAIATTGLSDPHTSLGQGASVFILDVDPSSPSYGKRSAAEGIFLTDGGPFGASNLLAVLPYQGVPLLPGTRYAALVLRSQQDTKGKDICAAPAMADLLVGTQPKGMSTPAFAEYKAALTAFSHANVTLPDIAAMTVFTTDTPTAELATVRSAMLALPLPKVSGAWTANEVFPTYCVFSNTIPMPDYQGGTPPYTSAGGGWVFDSSGAPVLQAMQEANFVVTVPRAPMPANGYPIVNMSRTGAGGNRPLIDRGQEATNGGPSIVPGTGPALYFAAAGFAGAEIDGPLGGLRNPTAPDTADNEDYTIFNVANPEALRDNIRESAVELSLTASILASLSIDASSCPGLSANDAGLTDAGTVADGGVTADGGALPGHGMVHFDASTMALFSHSMGSTISPLTLAFEPRYRAAILSGAGGSWIENIIYKQQPLDVKPLIQVLLGIGGGSSYSLTEGDPIVNLFQWAAESADAPVYDSRTVQHPLDGPARNVLKVQGIIDHYILPPICNTTTLSLGLDLAGPALDQMNPGLSMYTPLLNVIDLSGRKQISLPASGNITTADGGAVTAVVSQFPADGIEDGHEVIFQTDPPKHEYLCLLRSLAAGQVPRVPTDGGALSSCE